MSTPEKGDFWIIQDLPESTIPEIYGTISRFFEKWADLNGRKVEITKRNMSKSTWSFVDIETRGECKGISRQFFNEKVASDFAVTKECCRPSVSLCDECKVKFIDEMVDKGKRYNRWERTWK